MFRVLVWFAFITGGRSPFRNCSPITFLPLFESLCLSLLKTVFITVLCLAFLSSSLSPLNSVFACLSVIVHFSLFLRVFTVTVKPQEYDNETENFVLFVVFDSSLFHNFPTVSVPI